MKKLMDEMRLSDPVRGEELTDVLRANHRGLLSSTEANIQLAAGLGMTEREFRQSIDAGEIKNQPILDYIIGLRKTYKTALLSNIGSGSLKRRFSEDEFQKYFDAVVISGEVGFAKPEAEIYQIAAERLGVRADECVFTDDRLEFCEAASVVGMQSILYTGFEQFKAKLQQLF